MSRHEGVSCDSCMKGNFRGKRFKCLVCYDYDLCSTCYEASATTTRHTTDHPMQCILTRADFDVFYGGEALTAEQPQSYTCPHCSKMGFSETTLQEHVSSEHSEASGEVVCPICASLPGGDPNHVTEDFASHLSVEHRTPRDYDEPPHLRHVRRIPHPGRGVGGPRTRRPNMQHFGSGGSSLGSSALTGLSPSTRENMDPIAELLSQLSSVRNRAAAAQSVSSQLQQLEMQLQTTRQQLERLPRRPAAESYKPQTSSATASSIPFHSDAPNPATNAPKSDSQFLLTQLNNERSVTGAGISDVDEGESPRNMFVQELLLATLTDQLCSVSEEDEDPSSILEVLRSPGIEGLPQKEKQKTDDVHSKHRNISGGVSQASLVGAGGAAPRLSSSAGVRESNTLVSTSQGCPRSQVCGSITVGGTVSVHGPSVASSGSASSASVSVLRGRERPMNPASAKRNLLRHMPPQRGATDTEPPPH